MATNDVPWDDETDGLISSIDAQTSAGPKLRDFLLNPERFMLKPGAGQLVEKLRSSANTYFDAVYDDMKDEQAKLTQQLESMNAQYIRMKQVIQEKAVSLKVPYITPALINVDRSMREDVTIAQYDSTADQLIGKLISTAKYVADISTKYKEYTLGSWLFSCDRAYILFLDQPRSPLMYLERSRTVINDLIDGIVDQYGTGT